MSIVLFGIVLLVNFLFMMLTSLLSVLVFGISSSAAAVGAVLTVFMVSLLVIRIVCLKVYIKPVYSVITGSCLFFLAFLVLFFFNRVLPAYYFGSILFGISIGLIPPALLTLTTKDPALAEKNVKIYNSIVAVTSAVSTLFAERIYDTSKTLLLTIWLIGSFIMLIFAVILTVYFKKEFSSDKGKTISTSKISDLFKNRYYVNIFVVLILSSISYGAVISYLPLYFEKAHFSIGLFYFMFWSAYIVAQFVSHSIIGIMSAKKTLLAALLCLALTMLGVSLITQYILLLLIGIVYGFSYGFLYNYFYVKASTVSDESQKNNIYAVIGLMSYIGVGLAPTFLAPFLKNGFRFVFAFSSIYIAAAIVFLIIFYREGNKNAN